MSNLANVEFDGLKMKSSQNIYCESFYFIDLYEEKNLKKFIKSTERMIRHSNEYKKYIELLRTNIHALNYDALMSNISNTEASLEFHHYPFSLYDICEILILEHLSKQDDITSFSIAKEVMDAHYKNIIGLIPLSCTNHELAHNGSIFLDKRQIFGDYKRFINEHRSGVSVDLMDKIEKLEFMSNRNTANDYKGIL